MKKKISQTFWSGFWQRCFGRSFLRAVSMLAQVMTTCSWRQLCDTVYPKHWLKYQQFSEGKQRQWQLHERKWERAQTWSAWGIQPFWRACHWGVMVREQIPVQNVLGSLTAGSEFVTHAQRPALSLKLLFFFFFFLDWEAILCQERPAPALVGKWCRKAYDPREVQILCRCRLF